MVIIKLFNGPFQFYLTSVKFDHNPVIETDKNLVKNIINTSLETHDNSNYQKVSPIHLLLNILLILVFSTPLISLTPISTLPSILPIPAKRRRKKPQKYLIQINLFTSLDIYFGINNFYYNNVNMRLPTYILLKQKVILGLLEKKVFQNVNLKNVPVGIQVFNL